VQLPRPAENEHAGTMRRTERLKHCAQILKPLSAMRAATGRTKSTHLVTRTIFWSVIDPGIASEMYTMQPPGLVATKNFSVCRCLYSDLRAGGRVGG